jgi:hypothetical protein
MAAFSPGRANAYDSLKGDKGRHAAGSSHVDAIGQKKAPNPGDGWALICVLRGAPGGMPTL